jgi:hypothetical protein
VNVCLDSAQIGTSGMGIFVAQAIKKFTQTKGLMATGHQECYETMLETARSLPIILFDTDAQDRRGWLVSAMSVMLHMVHVWMRDRDLSTERIRVDAAPDGGLAARKAILRGGKLVLRSTKSMLTAENPELPKQEYTLKDLVTKFWVELRSLRDIEAQHRPKDNIGLRLKRQRLCGWEFMDIVDSLDISRRREINCTEDWGILTEDILVLFGHNFGDVIRPAPGVRVCKAWKSIPTGENYLTASVPCLQLLSKRWAAGTSCTRPTDDVYWDPQDDLFEDCQQCDAEDQNVRCHKKP